MRTLGIYWLLGDFRAYARFILLVINRLVRVPIFHPLLAIRRVFDWDLLQEIWTLRVLTNRLPRNYGPRFVPWNYQAAFTQMFDPRQPGMLRTVTRLFPRIMNERAPRNVVRGYSTWSSAIREAVLRRQMAENWGINAYDDLQFLFPPPPPPGGTGGTGPNTGGAGPSNS